MWQVKSLDEAIEWLKRAPFEDGFEVEIRQVFEAEDFGPRSRRSSGSKRSACARGGQEALVGSVTTSTRGRPQCRIGSGSDAS